MLPIKFLKVGLPVTTLTVATIVTATLLFSSKEDIKLSSLNEEALENYDKEIETYKEEIVKAADEAKDDEKKDKLSEEKEVKDEPEKSPEKKKSLEELIQQKIEGVDGKQSVEKLLSNPEELVDEILKGAGIQTPSQEEKEQLLQKANELKKELEKAKTPQDEESEATLGGKPSKLEETGLPSEASESRTEEQDGSRKSEISMEVPSLVDREETQTDDLRKEVPERSATEEELAEGSPTMQEKKSNEAQSSAPGEANTLSKDNLEHDSMEGEETEETLGHQNSIENKDSEGGDSDQTIFDIEKLNSLGEELSDAISSLGLKLN